MTTFRCCTLSALTLLIGAGCQKDFTSPVSSLNLRTNVDTINANVAPGIDLNLVGFRDTYTLDDTLWGSIVLRNYGSPTPFLLWQTDLPLNLVYVTFPGSSDPVYYYPWVIEFVEFYDTLRIGDSLSIRMFWDQSTWDAKESRWTGLKAFAGRYQLGAELRGNRLLNHDLTKFVTINETGNPICGALRVDYSSTDTVKADFIIRNRVSRAVPLAPLGSTPITMAFLAGSDTLIVRTYSLSAADFRLGGFSDTVILHFRAARNDTSYARLKGAFDMRAALHLNSRTIIASGFMYLP